MIPCALVALVAGYVDNDTQASPDWLHWFSIVPTAVFVGVTYTRVRTVRRLV
ncbi:MAG: hypothetical protein MHM6MM_007290 [Cercozoa sp. M6MM]